MRLKKELKILKTYFFSFSHIDFRIFGHPIKKEHDAKGKEFNVVILLNDFSNNSEETRRLFYVAMTRAKERLLILQDDNKEVDYLGEIPHEEIKL